MSRVFRRPRDRTFTRAIIITGTMSWPRTVTQTVRHENQNAVDPKGSSFFIRRSNCCGAKSFVATIFITGTKSSENTPSLSPAMMPFPTRWHISCLLARRSGPSCGVGLGVHGVQETNILRGVGCKYGGLPEVRWSSRGESYQQTWGRNTEPNVSELLTREELNRSPETLLRRKRHSFARNPTKTFMWHLS